MDFGNALKEVRKGNGIRLSCWNENVIIRAQFPDENSKMTFPYLYVESFKDGKIERVPWNITNLELFSEEWEVVYPDYTIIPCIENCKG